MKKILLYLSVLCILFYSCTKKETYIEYTGIPASIINKSLLKQIDFYKNKHPEYNTLLILSDIDENWFENHKIHNYWIIGPAYKDMCCLTKEVSLFFKYKNTLILLQSSLDGLTASSYTIKMKHKKIIIKIVMKLKRLFTRMQ